MKIKITEKIYDFIKSNNIENSNEVLANLITNRLHTQNKVIYYRKTFFIASSIYVMIILDIFDPSIIGIKFNDITESKRAFGFNNLLEFIVLMAPIIFSLLYYVLVLSLVHRSVLNIAINKIHKKKYKKEAMLHFLNFPFSSGLLISLLSTVSNNRLISWLRKNTKHIEYLFFVCIIFYTFFILINRILSAKIIYRVFSIASISFATVILINTWRTIILYKTKKKHLQ